MRSRTGTAFSPVKESPAAADWEVRPSGMLVQTRGADACPPVPAIRVKVKHGAACHEIYIGALASFGELKKALSAKTGLHPLDMKLSYKNRERQSAAFLDSAGVMDKSKLLLEEDPAARTKRLLDLRKADKAEKTAKSISAISLEVDRLGSKVSEMEAMVNQNRKVVDNDVTDLIASLMNELVKLDGIVADGDVNVQRRLQIKMTQKYVETLDFIKLKNTQLSKHHSQSNQMLQKRDSQQPHNPFQQQNQQQQKQETAEFQQQTQQPVVMTMNWETFDSLFTPSTSSTTTTASSTPHASFDWEQF
ncbi:BAG family molecular chaperone regulator 1-like isoform X1 [Zingiber officinale]|uniref:BAG family molecular chaperone regulator 1-like isoform X1 n=1 Tax=Zingiber officinale TaxID=94328 RepID=UPI001C4D4C9B|nr:BAG family molecular chaperone regulator 1-like isoform X1 [Zingiber officinale]XP_042407270.1 BAG family molecular chaperone regulator 1-like isoform X1 [Zingiber officinale]